MLNNFYIKTTVTFDVSILVDGVAPVVVDDTITFIMKHNINDTDEEAVLTSIGVPTDEDGVVAFTLSATDTDVDAGTYVYEIKWVSGIAVHIIESSSVSVLKRVFD